MNWSFLLSVLIASLQFSPSAYSYPPLPFYCRGLAGNFPGDVLYLGKWNRVAYYSWYEYGPAGDLSGPARACTEAVDGFNEAIRGRGLCLCTEASSRAAEIDYWPGGTFSFEKLRIFSRVEPEGEPPRGPWGKAMEECLAALPLDGRCPH